MHRRLFLALPGLLLVRPALATAPDATQASALVKTLLTRVLDLVNGNDPDKTAKLQQMVDTHVDVNGIAQFCVGRYWRTATPQQKSAYQALFHKVLLRNVMSRIGDYQGTSFTMGGATPRDGSVGVLTVLTRPNNAPNKVEWLIADVGDGAGTGEKVIDVIAEGTSLRLTQRSDYLSFIGQNGGSLQALIDALQKQTQG